MVLGVWLGIQAVSTRATASHLGNAHRIALTSVWDNPLRMI